MKHVAVIGATGAVGDCMIRLLEEREFPVGSLIPIASERRASEGRTISFKGESIPVQAISERLLGGLDLVLSSTPASASKQWSPSAARSGAVVVDNSSAFRMDPRVPLVVPEVNPEAIATHKGIIANPNCSTIQMVVALKPLHDNARVRRVIVSTYQSVSGAGAEGILELEEQQSALLEQRTLPEPSKFNHQIAHNCLPQIDVFLPDAYTKEERKMIDETQKIMSDDTIEVVPTCVRVPVPYSHSESIWVETERPITPEEARDLWRGSPGITVIDDPATERYPLALEAEGKDDVFLGRIRQDPFRNNALLFWCVSDNLRKGAATNAVQIAEELLKLSTITSSN